MRTRIEKAKLDRELAWLRANPLCDKKFGLLDRVMQAWKIDRARRGTK